MESLQKAQTKVSAEYGEHSIHVGKNPLLGIKLGRVMKRLEVLFQIGEAV